MFLGALNELRFPCEIGPCRCHGRPLQPTPFPLFPSGQSWGGGKGGPVAPPPATSVGFQWCSCSLQLVTGLPGPGERSVLQGAALVDLPAHRRAEGGSAPTGLLRTSLGDSGPSLEGGALVAGDDCTDSLASVGVLARLACNPLLSQRGLSCSRSSPPAFPQKGGLRGASDGPFLEGGRGRSLRLTGAEAHSVGACHPHDICRSRRADVVAADSPVVGLGTSERRRGFVPGRDPWLCLPAKSLCPRGRGLDGPLRLKRLMLQLRISSLSWLKGQVEGEGLPPAWWHASSVPGRVQGPRFAKTPLAALKPNSKLAQLT